MSENESLLFTRILAFLLLSLPHCTRKLKKALLFGFFEILRYQLDLLILCLKMQVHLCLETEDYYALYCLKAVQLRDEHFSHLARYQDDSPH